MATVFLVGFMGSGKTSVGREFARRSGGSFVDLDDRLAERFECPVRAVFERRGETAFREAELEELDRVLREAPAVVATGGGTYCTSAGREHIRRGGGVAVYLDVPWEVLLARIGSKDPSRPLWDDAASAHRLFERRQSHYRHADLILKCRPGDTPATVADRLAARLEGMRCAT